jgi:BirA family biotin operon repressor/biotin-[acetyl-CoA-carboxylase] ligase
MIDDGPEDPWIAELRALRRGKRIGAELLFARSLESTNRQAHAEALRGAGEGLVVLADAQTRGKGRLGRPWNSPTGVNLYLSILLRPVVPLASAPQITLLAGVACAAGLAAAAAVEPRIKWPNDIFLQGRKVAGILAEMEAKDARVRWFVLGIGVNVNWRREDMPPDLRETATSLQAETGRIFSRARVAAAVLAEVERDYEAFLREGFSPELREKWNRLSWVNGKWATLIDGREQSEGRIAGIDTDGALLLIDREGTTRRFIAGDVSLRLV